MKFKAVKKILDQAQANECHGFIRTASGNNEAFDFCTYEGNDTPDIIGYDKETETVSILTPACNHHIDCDFITQIDVYPSNQ